MIRMMVVGGLVTVDNTPQHDILDCYKMEQNSERVNTPYFHSLRERTNKIILNSLTHIKIKSNVNL